MTIKTADAVDLHIARLASETDAKPSTLKGYGHVLNRLVKASPELPVGADAFNEYLGDPETTDAGLRIRRWDMANRFLRGEDVQDLGIDNVCQEVVRPRLPAKPRPRLTDADRARVLIEELRSLVEPPAGGQDEVIVTADLVEKHLEDLRQKGAKSGTLSSYRTVLKRLAQASPTVPVSREAVYAALGDPADYKPSTRRRHYAVLRGFFTSDHYVALGFDYPLANITRPQRSKARTRVFTPEEIAALLVKANAQEAAFVRLGLDTGLRVGEISSIVLAYVADDAVEVEGKDGVRAVPASPQVIAELRALADADGVVWHENGARMTADQLDSRFRGLVRRAGIKGPQIGAHTLRRTFATSWADSSGGSRHLQEIMGHSHLSTTEEYIANVVPEEVKQAHRRFSPAARMGLLSEMPRVDRSAEAPAPSETSPRSFLPEIAAAAFKRDIEGALLLEAAVDYLKDHPCAPRREGRPTKELFPDIARMVILDYEAGYTKQAIVDRFKPVASFSRSWLSSRIADGGLWRMAGWPAPEHNVSRNIPPEFSTVC